MRPLKTAFLHTALDGFPGLGGKTTLNEANFPGIRMWLEANSLVGIEYSIKGNPLIRALIPITNFKLLIEADSEKVLEASDRFTGAGKGRVGAA